MDKAPEHHYLFKKGDKVTIKKNSLSLELQVREVQTVYLSDPLRKQLGAEKFDPEDKHVAAAEPHPLASQSSAFKVTFEVTEKAKGWWSAVGVVQGPKNWQLSRVNVDNVTDNSKAIATEGSFEARERGTSQFGEAAAGDQTAQESSDEPALVPVDSSNAAAVSKFHFVASLHRDNPVCLELTTLTVYQLCAHCALCIDCHCLLAHYVLPV